MPRPAPCLAFYENLPALAAGEVCDPVVSAHAEVCAPCAAAIGRERRLVVMLRALPSAPEGEIPVPVLPPFLVDGNRATDTGRPRFRLLRLPAVAAALAAGVLAAVAVGVATRGGFAPGSGGAGSDGVGTLASAPALVGDLRIVDALGFASGPDDRLLAITGGPEAVAARHSASAR